MAHTDDDAEISLNNFTLMTVRLQLDIEATPCIDMICCRLGTFPSQTTILFVYRSRSSTSSDDWVVLQAIQNVFTVLGECLHVGGLNAPAVDRSNRSCPKSDGFNKSLFHHCRGGISLSVIQPTRFRMGNQPSVLHPVFPVQSQQPLSCSTGNWWTRTAILHI